MKYQHAYILFLFVALLAINSCSDNEYEGRDPIDYSFYPLSVGNEWIYQVDSILISGGGSVKDTTSSQVRERITDLIEEDGNFRKYRVERSYRSDENEDWLPRHTWTTSIDSERAYKTEDNLRFVKLVFPASVGKDWDATVYFDRTRSVFIGTEEVQYFINWDTSILYEESRNQQSVIGVIHVDDDDMLYSKQYAVEEYTEGIGLTYSRILNYEDQSTIDESVPWENKVETGFEITHTLISSQIN